MKLIWPPVPGAKERHRLDPARIIETAEDLVRSVGDRLPGSSLAGLAVELAQIARATDERARHARRPIHIIRLASLAAIMASLPGLWYLAAQEVTRLDPSRGQRTRNARECNRFQTPDQGGSGSLGFNHRLKPMSQSSIRLKPTSAYPLSKVSSLPRANGTTTLRMKR
jgi:hypothetical protein